jgi:REP element-mobilizing transposase RayT
MRKRRKFYSGKVNHVYQRTENWVNIFYSDEDFLVYYTIFSVCTRSSDIIALELCLMYDHTHALIITENVQELSSFMDRFSSWFVKEYNHNTGRKGKLFHKNYGSAPKWSDKDIRSAINYVGNNPVEKQLCERAEQYRWNFLAYAISNNPFSEKYIPRKASRHLRNAIKEAKLMNEQNLPLKYIHLKRMMRELTPKERAQFIDQVIKMYLPFDFNKLISYYGSYETMLSAMRSNTGSDHDIKENNDRMPHSIFRDMISFLNKTIPRNEIIKLTTLPEDTKERISRRLKAIFNATDWQIAKFLHINQNKKG